MFSRILWFGFMCLRWVFLHKAVQESQHSLADFSSTQASDALQRTAFITLAPVPNKPLLKCASDRNYSCFTRSHQESALIFERFLKKNH